MNEAEKKKCSEIDICDLFITPAIKQAGWDQMQQIRREVTLAPAPVIGRGNLSSRNKKKRKFADYVLSLKPGLPLAVVEAKDNSRQGRCNHGPLRRAQGPHRRRRNHPETSCRCHHAAGGGLMPRLSGD